MELQYDVMMKVLDEIGEILKKNGIPEGTISIGFNPESIDSKLQNLSTLPKTEKVPITTQRFECHFGGCGLICCTF